MRAEALAKEWREGLRSVAERVRFILVGPVQYRLRVVPLAPGTAPKVRYNVADRRS